jgi:hypothetical protein
MVARRGTEDKLLFADISNLAVSLPAFNVAVTQHLLDLTFSIFVGGRQVDAPKDVTPRHEIGGVVLLQRSSREPEAPYLVQRREGREKDSITAGLFFPLCSFGR